MDSITGTDFFINPMAKHLRFFLCPAVLEDSWSSPMEKFEGRVRSIASAGASPAVGSMLFSSRAAPCLGYASQLLPPLANIVKREAWAANEILHTPLRSLLVGYGGETR